MSKGYHRLKPGTFDEYEETTSDQICVRGTDSMFLLACKTKEGGEVGLGLRRKHVEKLVKEAQAWLEGRLLT